jgi:two-component system, sporulation sensor kinase B
VDLLTKDLLINFLFIILPLLFWQMLILTNSMYGHIFVSKGIFAFSSLISLILCIKFPFPYGKFILDLSAIPLILGILYGGKKLIILLTSWALLIRYLVGDNGIFVALIVLLLFAIFLFFFTKHYIQWSLKLKLLVNSAAIVLLITVALFISKQIYGSYMGLDTSIKYIVINVLSMVFTTILIEVIKKNFEVLQKVIKAEKREVASHLAASISHEVRNPLTASKGFLQLLGDRDLSFQKRKEYLDFALEELDNAVEIINDYLTFAKPAAVNKEKIVVFEEIQNAIKTLSPLAKKNKVKISLLKEVTKSYFFIGDRKKFGQCLINILKNGIESMPSGGKLYIDLEIEDTLIKIEIQDEGMGMTPEQITRLGEPYFSTKENGTGLGLMVSFSIIEEMGGNISVRSNPSIGTCFSINLQTSKLYFN